MRFEDAMVALRAGKRVYFGELPPFDLDGIPNLNPDDIASRDDWKVYEQPMSDDELIAAWQKEADAHEAEAKEREDARMTAWEKAASEARASGQPEPEKPRAARSSIAQTLRRCAESLRVRQVVKSN